MTEEIRYIANLQKQEEFDNEVTELKDELKRLEQENKELLETLTKGCYQNLQHECRIWELKESKYRSALEEIEHGIMHIPPFDKQSAQMIEALLKLINEVLQ